MKSILLEDPTTRARLGASVPALPWRLAPPGTPPVEDTAGRGFRAGGHSSSGAKPKEAEAARKRFS